MATRILAGDLETIGHNETVVISNLAFSVATILPVIVDPLSHGYKRGVSNNNQGVLDGHSLTISANGAGNVNVLDSHQMWVAIVYARASKTFTAEGIEVGNRWRIA